MLPTGYSAYANTHARTLKGHSAEGEALGKASRLLEKARLNLHDKVTLGQALQFNQKLWTIFQADLIDSKNPLPDDLKADILSLSVYMDKTIAEISEESLPNMIAKSLQSMIEINRSLAASLLK